MADYLETNASTLIQNRTILEMGAGAGLPSLICALNGAKKVVVTDYPDADLIENLRCNIDHCPDLPDPKNVVADGYLWGASTANLISNLPESERNDGFVLLILADLLFNHSEHGALLRTIESTLYKHPDSKALVFFTPYRPWLLEKDMAFFDLARSGDFVVEKIFEKVMDKVMFEEDPGVSLPYHCMLVPGFITACGLHQMVICSLAMFH